MINSGKVAFIFLYILMNNLFNS